MEAEHETLTPSGVAAPGRGVGEAMEDGPEEAAPDFDEFFSQVHPSLYRLAVARTGDPAAADDLAQEALADAHRRWTTIGSYEQPAAWARRAVLNRSASWHRRAGREQRALRRLTARRDNRSAEAEPVFEDAELWSAIRGLSDQQQRVVLLMWFEDLTVVEVADTLGCGEETVRTHWRRARARLAEVLGEADDSEGRDRDGGERVTESEQVDESEKEAGS